MTSTAFSFGMAPRPNQARADTWAIPTMPMATISDSSRSRSVKVRSVLAMACAHSTCSARTRVVDSGSLVRSDSNTSLKALPLLVTNPK